MVYCRYYSVQAIYRLTKVPPDAYCHIHVPGTNPHRQLVEKNHKCNCNAHCATDDPNVINTYTTVQFLSKKQNSKYPIPFGLGILKSNIFYIFMKGFWFFSLKTSITTINAFDVEAITRVCYPKRSSSPLSNFVSDVLIMMLTILEVLFYFIFPTWYVSLMVEHMYESPRTFVAKEYFYLLRLI